MYTIKILLGFYNLGDIDLYVILCRSLAEEENSSLIYNTGQKQQHSNRRESCEPKKAYYTNSAAFCAKRSQFPEYMEIIS